MHCVYIIHFFLFLLRKKTQKEPWWIGLRQDFFMPCHILYCFELLYQKALSVWGVQYCSMLSKTFFCQNKKKANYITRCLVRFQISKYVSHTMECNAASCNIGTEISLTQHTNDFYCSFQTWNNSLIKKSNSYATSGFSYFQKYTFPSHLSIGI